MSGVSQTGQPPGSSAMQLSRAGMKPLVTANICSVPVSDSTAQAIAVSAAIVVVTRPTGMGGMALVLSLAGSGEPPVR